MKHFDAIIIGTGQAGPSLAARFADGRDEDAGTAPHRSEAL
jgi:pyruvate/2-oxoglutarate dehydrogenase complex dihydrolipoamide dehydrogenase (E3) component